MIKIRVALPVLAAVAAFALLSGCGGGDSGSSTDPASLAPPETPVFVEATIQPTGTLKSNLEGIASKVAGVDDLGGTLVSYLERAAGDSSEPLDFEKEVQPWLGEKAGIFLSEYDGQDFKGTGIAVEVTDTGEAQDFIDKRIGSTGEELEEKSYEGVDYKFDPSDEKSVGIVGSFVVYGENKATFEAAVDASQGDSLADADRYKAVSSSAAEGSLADVYADVGGLVRMSGSQVDPETLQLLEAAGLDAKETSLLMSLVPGTDNVEVDLTGKFGGTQKSVTTNAATDLLASMPANSVAAFGVGDFGTDVGNVIDEIDASGIPGKLPPHQLKAALAKTGIDLDKIASSLGDAAVFAQGRTRATLGGALVIEAKDPGEAKSLVANIGTLLRANGTPGVTAIAGKASGFSVRSRSLGPQPLVVATKGERVAVGYGLAPTLAGLESGSGSTLSQTKTYNEALDSLGGTPITGFAAGAPALRLAESLLAESGEKEELEAVTPYLSKIPFLAIGSEVKDGVVQAKLILGVAG
jgi:hypothetical protein